MKKDMRKYLLVGLICEIIIFNLTGCKIEGGKIVQTPEVKHYSMTSIKDPSKIIGSKGLILIKINDKPGPLNNFRGLAFSPRMVKVYNKEIDTFEVDLEPGEYALEFDFYEYTGSSVARAKEFVRITLRIDRCKCYYLDYTWNSQRWRVYVSKVEKIF
jgi:hypothetical protein